MNIKLQRLLQKYSQKKLIEEISNLSAKDQKKIFDDLNKLHTKGLLSKMNMVSSINKNEFIPLQKGNKQKIAQKHLAEKLIQQEKIGIILLSGGSGSRLGVPFPKGRYPVTLVKKKSLFEYF